MKKIIQKIKCFLGRHKWRYFRQDNHEYRQCEGCGITYEFDGYNIGRFGQSIEAWVRVEPEDN